MDKFSTRQVFFRKAEPAVALNRLSSMWTGMSYVYRSEGRFSVCTLSAILGGRELAMASGQTWYLPEIMEELSSTAPACASTSLRVPTLEPFSVGVGWLYAFGEVRPKASSCILRMHPATAALIRMGLRAVWIDALNE
jgi:hypothetical protein